MAGFFSRSVLPQMQPVFAHAVGMQFGHLEPVTVQLGNLYVRCKGGNHEGDTVAFVQQEILLQRIEDITHGSRSAFGGKQVESSARRTVVAHFLIQVVAYQHFGELQDAVGHRILVAYDAFRPFVYEAVGVDGMLHQHVVVGLFQQFGSGLVGIAFEELLKAGGNTLFFGDAGDAFGEKHDVTAFFQSEFSQKEKGFAWSGCNPVGITAPGVQHGTGGLFQAFICHVDKTVFQFKGTDILHLLF